MRLSFSKRTVKTVTVTDAINSLVAAAKAEVGYLEKVSDSSLDSKTANAGSGNFTKYWRDIKPSYQGLPWCACFVTWCFLKTFGKAMAARLLRHYPYVYCPSMANLFTLFTQPKKGDIVIFKKNGTFTHTGIVTGVAGNYFTTVEGNTSGGSTIIANGGGVYAKRYSFAALEGTRFCRPDYSILREEELMSKEYNELKTLIEAQSAKISSLEQKLSERTGFYNYIDKNMSEYYKPTIQKLVGSGILEGNENGELQLTTNMMRLLTVLDRAGLFEGVSEIH